MQQEGKIPRLDEGLREIIAKLLRRSTPSTEAAGLRSEVAHAAETGEYCPSRHHSESGQGVTS